MLTIQHVAFAFGAIALAILAYYMLKYSWQTNRKCDAECFVIGEAILMFFVFLLFLFSLDQMPSLLSSLVIAELTLALVWVELSKRPELKMGDLCPIIRDNRTWKLFYKAGYHNEPLFPSFASKLFKIKEVSYEAMKFDELFSFSFDLSNIGYSEIVVHEFEYFIDGKKGRTLALGDIPEIKRLKLITQQREPIDIPPLGIKEAGFHKIRITVLAMTVKCSKDVWIFTSKDFQKLRYVEMPTIKRLFSWFIKRELASNLAQLAGAKEKGI